MKKECEIIKDLLPSYIENLVSEETKKYIEEHVNNCLTCRNVLEDMQSVKEIECEQISREEEVEIRQIKKYRRKMTTLKVGIAIFVIVILLLVSSFAITYVPKYSIIVESYNKIQEIATKENYKFTINQYYINYSTQEKYEYTDIYYYKDNKYKGESWSNSLEKKKIYYGNVNSNTTIYIDENTKNVIDITTYQYKSKERIFDIFSDIKFNSKSIFNIVGINVRDDSYEGKDCYVFRYGNNNTSYREIWIDKESMLQVREIQEIYNNSYFERTFLIELNVVIDEDVQATQLDEHINESSN